MTEDMKGLRSSAHALRGRVLTDAEVRRILESAAEIDERSESLVARSGQGLTVEDLREIAREAGIDPQCVDIAIEQDRGSLEPQKSPLFGGPHSWRFHSEIPGTLTPEDRSDLVQAVRSLLDEQGQVTEVYRRMEWRHDDSLGPVTVSVYPKDGTVEIDVAANRQGEAGLVVGVGTFLGVFPASVLIASLINVFVDGSAIPDIFTLLVAAPASFGISRMIWRMRSSWWARRLRQISDQLSSNVQDIAVPTLPTGDAEPDRTNPLELPTGPADRGNDT